jgi:hypothetical protein
VTAALSASAGPTAAANCCLKGDDKGRHRDERQRARMMVSKGSLLRYAHQPQWIETDP